MSIQLQCQSCQKILKVDDSAAGKKARCPGCQSLIDIPAAVSSSVSDKPVANPKQPHEPAKSGTSSSPVKVTCQSCGKVLQAPGHARGKAVRCPGCQSVVKVPATTPTKSPSAAGRATQSKPLAPASVAPQASIAPTSSPTGGGLFDAFGNIPSSMPTSGGWDLPPASPYAVSNYSSSALATPRKPMDRTPFYIINGIFIALWGLLVVGFGVYTFVMLVIGLANIPAGMQINYPRLIGNIVGRLIAVILALVQLVGGIQMATRGNLSIARTAAIVAAIPCFGFLVFPFGIWATVLLFSKSAKRDFGE